MAAAIAERKRDALDAGFGHHQAALCLLHPQVLDEVGGCRPESRPEAPRDLSRTEVRTTRKRIQADAALKVGRYPAAEIRNSIDRLRLELERLGVLCLAAGTSQV